MINNGSTDGTQKYLEDGEKTANIRVLHNEENLGFVKANNQGILMAQGEYICLANDDLVFTPRWLLKLKQCLDAHPKVGLVGPYTNYAGGRQRVTVEATDKKEADAFVRNFSRPEQVVDGLIFFCVLIRAELFHKDRCGLLDEDFHPRNFEDNYMCWLAKRMGYQMRIANCFVWHIGSVSWKKDLAGYVRVMGKNQKIFYRKTGRDVKISLCMAVADAEKPETLRQCLSSIAPFVDEICIAFNYKYYPKRWRYEKLMAVLDEFRDL